MTLKEAVEETLKSRKEWLKEAREAVEMVEALPEEIQNLDADVCGVDRNWKEGVDISLNFYGSDHSEKAKACMEVLKKYGIYFLDKPQARGKDSISVSTEAIVKDVQLNLCILGASVPPNCRIIEKVNLNTYYEVECSQDRVGEKV